jgi:transcriptional regulator of heat shock response
MIRFELEELVDLGFLEQPHHSAGRIPSDRGYGFFVEQMLQDETKESADRTLKNLFDERSWENLVERLSSKMKLLSVVADTDRGFLHKAGIDSLLERFLLDDPREMLDIVRDFVDLDERIEDVESRLGEKDIEVFFGKNSPVSRSENLAVVAGSYQVDGGRVHLFAIGPKRMDYKKIVNSFRCLQ